VQFGLVPWKSVLPTSLEYFSWTVEDELQWMSNGKKWAGSK
jgi:hypothetical protein